MVKRGDLPEPTSAAHLARLKPSGRVGGKMSRTACEDPDKAKYIGRCCGGVRVWGELGADVYHDEHEKSEKKWAVFCCGACKAPLPLPPVAVPAPLTATQQQRAEQQRQLALARKRAREEDRQGISPHLADVQTQQIAPGACG
jgi:predicted small lipoprotein YifL